MINLAPWYYRNLLGKENAIIEPLEFYEVTLLNNTHQFEASALLKPTLRPSWLKHSELYRNTDGSGADIYKNIAIYKAISEALERWAFYESVDTEKYCFDSNPTTTGMAAFPHYSSFDSRLNAKAEAVERWAIHEFNRFNLPILLHSTFNNLNHYEIITPFKGVVVTLLEYWNGIYYSYGFAGGKNKNHSYLKALTEMDRNVRVLGKVKDFNFTNFQDTVDKTLVYFSTKEGNEHFAEMIKKAPKYIKNETPIVLCDTEILGPWTQYTKVWRYLIENSYYDCRESSQFFMF
jgi:hypothetical protein